jgi:HrpA-like RNA helicase
MMANKVNSYSARLVKNICDCIIPLELPKSQYNLAAAIVRKHVAKGTGVLIFVSGIADIIDLSERFTGNDTYSVVCIHSDIPFEEQELAFQPIKPNEIRIVIATNAAESSITLPVDVVICLGTNKMTKYNPTDDRVQLANAFISKASATQRAGRTGRGEMCYCTLTLVCFTYY